VTTTDIFMECRDYYIVRPIAVAVPWCLAPLQAEISYGMYELGVHLLFINFPAGVHWQEKRSVRRIVHYAHVFDAG
jgi:hypothetical protein